MIRFNWYKLRSCFETRLPRDERMNRRRPWWLRTGQIYYVAGNVTDRWVLVGFSRVNGRKEALLTGAAFNRGREAVHPNSLLLSPLK